MSPHGRHRRGPVAYDAGREARAARLRVVHGARRRRRVLAPARADRLLAHGIGEITRIGATTGLRPRDRAAFTNAIQRYLVESTRLGIPAIVHEESTAGLCARDATQFPQAIGLASAWDPDLIERIGVVIREQMVATGRPPHARARCSTSRAIRAGAASRRPTASPRISRRRLGVAYVRGVQGDLADGVAATGKHFLGYALSEGGLNHAPVQLGPRELREVVAEPFRAAIAEAGPRDRDELVRLRRRAPVRRFEGDPRRPAPRRARLHRRGRRRLLHDRAADVAPSHRGDQGRGRPARARSRASTWSSRSSTVTARRSVRSSKRAKSTSRSSTGRSVGCSRSKDALGPVRPAVRRRRRAPARAYARPADRALAREAAVKSLVLLRNEGELLPLSPAQRVAVIGPAADDERLLQGDYSYPAHTEIVQPRDREGRLIEPAGDFAPGPVLPRVDHAAGRHPRDRGRRHLRQGRRRARHERPTASRDAVADARAADVAICFVGGRVGPHARLHERRVPRRERSRPARACSNSSSRRSSRPARRPSWSS